MSGIEKGRLDKSWGEACFLLYLQSLKHQILSENNALKEALNKNDEFRIICYIREWAYKISNIAPKELRRSMPNLANMQTLDVETAKKLYEQRLLGTVCGGTNIFLSKIYHAFQYRSTTYNFGIEADFFTHQICLVESKNGNVLYMMDAFFNGYVSVKGKPVNFLNLEKLIKNTQEIHFTPGETKEKVRLTGLLQNCSNKYATNTVEFSWEDAIRWFNKKNKTHRLNNFFELLKYPLNYTAIGSDGELNIIKFLNYLSKLNNTRYHKIKSNKLWEQTNDRSDNIHLPKRLLATKKRIIIYGINGYGITIYNLFVSYNSYGYNKFIL